MKIYSSLLALILLAPLPVACNAASIPVIVCTGVSCKVGLVESLSIDFKSGGGITSTNAQRMVSFSHEKLSRIAGINIAANWLQVNFPGSHLQTPVLHYTDGFGTFSYRILNFGVVYFNLKWQNPHYFFDLSLEKP